MARKKIAILFSGQGTNFSHIVNTFDPDEVEIVVALTNNPNAQGIQIAKEASIALEIIDSSMYQQREVFDAEVVKILQRYAPDLSVLAGFMRILTPVFTQTIKSINLHPSLLPKHKGLNAIEKSYQDEDAYGGVSVHYVSDELDGGEVILQKKISKKGLDFTAYHNAIKEVEKEALAEAIREVLDI
jgi:phosphoribosylglycinamide formyltransferase-1